MISVFLSLMLITNIIIYLYTIITYTGFSGADNSEYQIIKTSNDGYWSNDHIAFRSLHLITTLYYNS
jgi:hypothetical protein